MLLGEEVITDELSAVVSIIAWCVQEFLLSPVPEHGLVVPGKCKYLALQAGVRLFYKVIMPVGTPANSV